MPDFLKEARRNLFANVVSKSNWNNILWAMLGAVIEPVIPSAIQGLGGKDEKRLPKWNMSGWKGLASGVIGGTLIGYLVNRPAIAFGSIATGTAHLFWVKAQDSIMELTGFPIPPFDPNAVVMSDDLPEGYKAVTLPSGKTIIAEVSPQGQQLSEYINGPKQLSDYLNPTNNLSEYVNPTLAESNYPTEPGIENISEYVNPTMEDYEYLVDNGYAID